jgi:hypothetical protein
MDTQAPRHPVESIEGQRAESDPMLQSTVVDAGGEEIGTVDTAWLSTTTGDVEFIGIATGWVSLKVVAVPIAGADIDLANCVIRLPYTTDVIKEAPHFAQHGTLTEDQKADVYEHFRSAPPGLSKESE